MKYTWTCAEYNSVIYPREKVGFLIVANEVIALKLSSKDRKRLSHLRKTKGVDPQNLSKIEISADFKILKIDFNHYVFRKYNARN